MFLKDCRCGASKKNFEIDIGEFYVDECCIKAGYDELGNPTDKVKPKQDAQPEAGTEASPAPETVTEDTTPVAPVETKEERKAREAKEKAEKKAQKEAAAAAKAAAKAEKAKNDSGQA